MPALPIPSDYLDLLENPTVAHLATVDEQGRPQANPVWFLWDGENITMSMQANTIKYRNLRANPAMALSMIDPADPHRYLEIRGEAVDWELYLTLDYVNELAMKYTGTTFDDSTAGEERYKVTFKPRWWTGQI